jgi:transcription-repair coupling factor (superfamily II helicase)
LADLAVKTSAKNQKPQPQPSRLSDLAVKNSFSSFQHLSISDSQLLPAFIPTGYLADAKLRINAYRELAEANTPKSIISLEKNWIDRHGRLPHPVQNLFTIARIKAEAASNSVSSVELSNQRLILHRNGSPILLDGSRFPRLTKSKPAEKLEEALEMLRNF